MSSTTIATRQVSKRSRKSEGTIEQAVVKKPRMEEEVEEKKTEDFEEEEDQTRVELDEVLDGFLSKSVSDEDDKKDIIELHALIRKHAPTLEPTTEFVNTLGYGKYHYKYKSGREGDWVKIGIAVRKKSISLHFAAIKDGKYVLEVFDTKSLGKPKHVGKSCIRFSRLADLNKTLLKKIIETTAKADIMT